MIVVADTSPLHYLILIDEIDLLPALFGRIFVTRSVLDELGAGPSPGEVKKWLTNLPGWLEIRVLSKPLEPSLYALLDLGESEAIQLAEELDADLVLMDEKRGRQVVSERGLRALGIIGVLAAAAGNELIDIEDAVEKLEKTNFYISVELKDHLRKLKLNG